MVGFILLIKGADWLVNGASSLAKKYNVSNLAIGLTVVAFGTSAPELVVNVFAAAQGHQDIAFGNVIGSNIFNLFVILGIAGLITPLVVKSSTVWKEIPLSFIAIIALYFLANNFFVTNSSLSRFDGVVLIVIFIIFLIYVYKQLKTADVDISISNETFSKYKVILLIVGGLIGLVVGGKFIVDSAVSIALDLGVSEKLISLTIVAFGTSLPELATSIVAAYKRNVDIAVGNIIGSNIFNIFLILGVSSVITPLNFDTVFNIDLLFLAIGTSILFLAMFTGKKKILDRWEAILLLALYVGYTIFSIGKHS